MQEQYPDNTIRVFCDALATGVWSEYGSIEPEELGLTPQTIQLLKVWQGWYDQAPCFDDDDGIPLGPEFEQLGKLIYELIKQQLPNHNVVYLGGFDGPQD